MAQTIPIPAVVFPFRAVAGFDIIFKPMIKVIAAIIYITDKIDTPMNLFFLLEHFHHPVGNDKPPDDIDRPKNNRKQA